MSFDLHSSKILIASRLFGIVMENTKIIRIFFAYGGKVLTILPNL